MQSGCYAMLSAGCRDKLLRTNMTCIRRKIVPTPSLLMPYDPVKMNVFHDLCRTCFHPTDWVLCVHASVRENFERDPFMRAVCGLPHTATIDSVRKLNERESVF